MTTPDDMDVDGHPGVTVAVATGPTITPSGMVTLYSYIPTDVPPPFQPFDFASSLYLAIRQVTVATGVVENCNTITGTVSIPTIGSKPAIHSHILGCALVDGGGQCTTGAGSQAAFVDNSEPIFAPAGPTTFQSFAWMPTRHAATSGTRFTDLTSTLFRPLGPAGSIHESPGTRGCPTDTRRTSGIPGTRGPERDPGPPGPPLTPQTGPNSSAS